MFIDLSWTDLNSVATKLEIYRGDTPLDRANLPATPIVTLTAGETSYRDETNIALGKTYYYVFVNSTATDRVVSQVFTVRAVTRRGPGPQSLKQGDNNLGYFGLIQSGEFISGSDFVDQCGIKAFAPSISILNPFPAWHKFVRNNKILIVPEGVLANSISWQQLYTAGMVFGTDDNGVLPAGNSVGAGVLQNARITIGRDVFRIRLMRGMGDGVFTDYATAVATPNEWNDLVYPMVHPVPADQRLENLYLNGSPTYNILGGAAYTGYSLVQELATSGTSTVNGRGQSVNVSDTTTDTSSYVAIRTTTALTSATTALFWFPVLELIEG
jgi:hypothetical protein